MNLGLFLNMDYVLMLWRLERRKTDASNKGHFPNDLPTTIVPIHCLLEINEKFFPFLIVCFAMFFKFRFHCLIF